MGEFSPIISETDGVELLVSVLVSILDPLSLKPLLHTQLVREARVGIERRFRSVTISYDVFQRRIKLNLLLLKLKTTYFYLQSTGDFTGDFWIKSGELATISMRLIYFGWGKHPIALTRFIRLE